MVRVTLLLNVLVLALVAAVLLGVELPAPDGLAAAAGEGLSRLQVWAGTGWTWAQGTLDRAVTWAAGQIG